MRETAVEPEPRAPACLLIYIPAFHFQVFSEKRPYFFPFRRRRQSAGVASAGTVGSLPSIVPSSLNRDMIRRYPVGARVPSR